MVKQVVLAGNKSKSGLKPVSHEIDDHYLKLRFLPQPEIFL